MLFMFLFVLMIHIVMDTFDVMINYILYVIIIMVIYGIKMTWKMPIILT
jgi:DMSO/TMAO reductase YedYZ heme-binding membrane subunit